MINRMLSVYRFMQKVISQATKNMSNIESTLNFTNEICIYGGVSSMCFRLLSTHLNYMIMKLNFIVKKHTGVETKMNFTTEISRPVLKERPTK